MKYFMEAMKMLEIEHINEIGNLCINLHKQLGELRGFL